MKVIQEHKSATYHDAFQGSLKYLSAEFLLSFITVIALIADTCRDHASVNIDWRRLLQKPLFAFFSVLLK